ncbi:AMP-binding protein [Caballeronia insecticola]|uniref:Acyl-coenzyme A synthetases/AMP-(Fatty) acid ligases-like protein n=1 Tax=Caballeronia insecticola TaxID=758793 RepID=R4WSX1_9BURK|nr:AMP-binding protein [Caballeronia insecticola]BAN27674.1 acyl-coenzyme A synthetases/AMP-(Fatty) acid ligases-like protein [Caballeronia insecticola]
MPTFPLVFHASPDQTLAWRDGAPVRVRDFLADVQRVAAALPEGGHVFNVCTDRYRFTVSLCATLVAGKTSLLPSTHTPEMVRALASFAPDAFCLHDSDDCAIDLPRVRYPDNAPTLSSTADVTVPQIDGARVVAYVFTSGSTGVPVPHRKTWGFLVKNVRAAAARLGLLDRQAATLVGTVPPQHMYGFESTVLLALLGGLAFSNRQPFYPVDIRAELAAVPEPRVLVSSPIHLRALFANEEALPRASLVLSATAPLSEKLALDAEQRLHAPLMEIYGSTETGQIATRRTARTAAWELFPDIALTPRADDSGDTTMWASGGHVEMPVPMGDALELIDATRFLLHGRKADLINIAGKRTSLAYLNHQLNAVPGVIDGVFYMPDDPPDDGEGEPVRRLMALVVAPELAAADLQRALRERIDAAFMPRPLLFVDTLPRNATGKLPREVLTRLIDEERKRRAALSFTVPPEHPALAGHFPGRPIVPGVVLLDHALDAIGGALGRSVDACRIESAKFLSPAQPGETLDIAFETAASGAVRFTIRAGARAVASGALAAPQASSISTSTSTATDTQPS